MPRHFFCAGRIAVAPLLLLLSTSPSVAQPPAAAADADEHIEEIQVTATRRQVRRTDVSAALTVVNSADIARGKLVTDALAAQPGVFLQQTTPGQGAVIIRGLKGSEVLHLVDGFRLNNAIFRNAPTQYLALVAPGTLERIEIVRGAPASLYGSDATGGVVQVISRVPSLDEVGIRGDATMALDTAELTKSLRASVEFGDRRKAALISGEYLDTGNRKIGGGDRVAPSGYSSRGARVALALTPDEERSWLFDVQLARQPLTPRIDELLPGFGQAQPSSSEFFFAPNERQFAHVRHSRKSAWWNADWVVDAGWQRINDGRISRDFQSDLRRTERNSSDLYGVSVSASAETASGSWIGGLEFYHDRVASTRFEENLATGITQSIASRFPDGSTMDHAAIFGNLLQRVNDRHTLSGGLRFSAIRTELSQTAAAPAASTEQKDVSADLGWVFNATQATQVTANAGFGFRAPNVFDLGTLGDRPGNRFNIPNPALESERVTQVDLGLRHRAERWDLDVVLFALHYAERITSVLTGDVTAGGREITQSRNVSSADIRGIELAGHWSIASELTADLVLNYLRGIQAEEDGSTVAADRIAPLNGRLSLEYQVSPSLTLEPYLVFAGSQDRLSPRDIQDARINPDGTPGYVTANVAGEWRLGEAWQLTVVLENLLDRRYQVHGSGIEAVGRNVYLGVRSSW